MKHDCAFSNFAPLPCFFTSLRALNILTITNLDFHVKTLRECLKSGQLLFTKVSPQDFNRGWVMDKSDDHFKQVHKKVPIKPNSFRKSTKKTHNDYLEKRNLPVNRSELHQAFSSYNEKLDLRLNEILGNIAIKINSNHKELKIDYKVINDFIEELKHYIETRDLYFNNRINKLETEIVALKKVIDDLHSKIK